MKTYMLDLLVFAMMCILSTTNLLIAKALCVQIVQNLSLRLTPLRTFQCFLNSTILRKIRKRSPQKALLYRRMLIYIISLIAQNAMMYGYIKLTIMYCAKPSTRRRKIWGVDSAGRNQALALETHLPTRQDFELWLEGYVQVNKYRHAGTAILPTFPHLHIEDVKFNAARV